MPHKYSRVLETVGAKVVIHRTGFASRKDNTSGLQKFMRTSIPALDCTNSSPILRNTRCKEDHVLSSRKQEKVIGRKKSRYSSVPQDESLLYFAVIENQGPPRLSIILRGVRPLSPRNKVTSKNFHLSLATLRQAS